MSMNISQRLRTCAKHTGLDAVIELLQEAADEIDALQARAQVQGVDAAIRTLAYLGYTYHGGEQWKPPLGTAPRFDSPQPAQATQADVTDEDVIFSDWLKAACLTYYPGADIIEPDKFTHLCKDDIIQLIRVASSRAILALRPAAVPMTDEQVDELCGEANRGYFIGREEYFKAFRDAEHDHGITAQADLWCIHIPGTDEVHAAPSKEAADHMAAKHNAAMATYYASGALNLEFAPTLESVQAAVVKWPHDKSSHYDDLSAFDWAAWGITAQAKKETP